MASVEYQLPWAVEYEVRFRTGFLWYDSPFLLFHLVCLHGIDWYELLGLVRVGTIVVVALCGSAADQRHRHCICQICRETSVYCWEEGRPTTSVDASKRG